MTERGSRIALWGAAAIAVIAGAGLTAGSLSQSRTVFQRLDRKRVDVERLEAMQNEMTRRRAMVARFAELKRVAPAPIADLVKSVIPDSAPEIHEPPPQPVVPGWSAQRAEISFAGVSLDRLARFIVQAESQRPPWRVVECAIRAPAPPGDTAPVRLVVEALERAK